MLSCNNEQKLIKIAQMIQYWNYIQKEREIIEYFPFGDTSRSLSLFSLNVKKDRLYVTKWKKYS